MGWEIWPSRLGDTDAPNELGICTTTDGDAPVATLADDAGTNSYPTISEGVCDATSSIDSLIFGNTFASCALLYPMAFAQDSNHSSAMPSPQKVRRVT
jgi:hypothetical protein